MFSKNLLDAVNALVNTKSIEEGITDVVFYYLSDQRIFSILVYDKLKMTPEIGVSDSEYKLMKRGKFFYISTTRSRTGDYHATANHPVGVLFQLDGRKLKQKYAGRPVDYWSNSRIQNDEMEDRVYSETEFIQDFHKYITAIDVVINTDAITGTVEDVIKFTNKYSNQFNIPLRFFDNQKDFVLGRRNVEKFNDVTLTDKDDAKPNFKHPVQELDSIVELLEKKSESGLSEDAAKFKHNLMFYGFPKLYDLDNTSKKKLGAGFDRIERHLKIAEKKFKAPISTHQKLLYLILYKWDDTFKSVIDNPSVDAVMRYGQHLDVLIPVLIQKGMAKDLGYERIRTMAYVLVSEELTKPHPEENLKLFDSWLKQTIKSEMLLVLAMIINVVMTSQRKISFAHRDKIVKIWNKYTQNVDVTELVQFFEMPPDARAELKKLTGI